MTQKSQEGAGVILKRRPSITPTQDKIHVGFAEIAIEELGYTDDDTDFYGLSEVGCVDGGYKMVELVEQHYISREDHDRRVTELLNASNKYLAQRRALMAVLQQCRDSGRYPSQVEIDDIRKRLFQ